MYYAPKGAGSRRVTINFWLLTEPHLLCFNWGVTGQTKPSLTVGLLPRLFRRRGAGFGYIFQLS